MIGANQAACLSPAGFLDDHPAALQLARQARAQYDTAKDLFDELEGKRAKKKRARKAVRQGLEAARAQRAATRCRS